MPSTEALGFVTGAVSVLLFVRRRVAAWPIGIANSAFWLLLFWQSKLYFDSALQLLFIALGFLGWYWWVKGRSAAHELRVTRTTFVEAATLVAAGVTATAALWFCQARWTDGALPFWDSSTTVVSLLAQYMLTKKLHETWALWIAVDVAYVGMYASQGLYLTAALQPLFILLCIRGISEWRAEMQSDSARPSAPAAPGP